MKNFASDKKVKSLVSYATVKQIYEAFSDGTSDGKVEDVGALSCSFFFVRLLLYAVNWQYVPATHRAFHLWISMIFFTSAPAVHVTPKQNVVSEPIPNLSMVLRSDVFKIWLLTSEPDKHGF